jgi:hypothetical protein
MRCSTTFHDKKRELIMNKILLSASISSVLLLTSLPAVAKLFTGSSVGSGLSQIEACISAKKEANHDATKNITVESTWFGECECGETSEKGTWQCVVDWRSTNRL